MAGNREEGNGFAIIAFVLSVFFIYRQGGKLCPCSFVPAPGSGDTGPPPSCSPRLPGGGILVGAGEVVGLSLPTLLWALLEPDIEGFIPRTLPQPCSSLLAGLAAPR